MSHFAGEFEKLGNIDIYFGTVESQSIFTLKGNKEVTANVSGVIL